MKVMANRMDRGFFRYQEEFESKALEVLRSGWYVLGNEVESFEEEFAAYTGGNHCVGLASGLDALWIAFRLLGIGKGDILILHCLVHLSSCRIRRDLYAISVPGIRNCSQARISRSHIYAPNCAMCA